MKVTVKQLLDAELGLSVLSATKFKGTTALRVARLIQKVEGELKTSKATLMKLFEEYGDKTDEGLAVGKEKFGAFDAERTALFAEEIEIHIDPLPFVSIAGADLTAQELLGLEPFLFIEEAAPAGPGE